MHKVILIASSLLIAGTAAASAASVNGKQARQYDRIETGRESGKITWTEGLKLRGEQNKIARTEAQYRADGYLSASERRKLNAMQHDASKHIAQEKQDGWTRAWWMPRIGR
jgi:hypothetical protein